MPTPTQRTEATNIPTLSPAKAGDIPPTTLSEVYVLTEDAGRTVISEDVVAKIIGLAVREIEGVHNLAVWGAGEAIVSLGSRLRGGEKRDIGVHVQIGKVECAADIRIVADYGASLPTVAKAIRERVSERVSTMTGLAVRELNIEVVDLHFDEAPPVSARQLR